MNVVVLTWTRIWGGLEANAVALAKRLAGRGHQVRLACVGAATADVYRGQDPSLPIVVLSEPAGSGSLRHWKREFGALQADACIFEKGTLHTGSFALDLAARLTFGAYVVIEQLEPPVLGPLTRSRHLGVPGLGVWWYRQRLRGWLRSLAPHRVVCVSSTVREGLVRDYGYSPDRLRVVHNGIDTNRYSPERRTAARAALELPVDQLVIATACRLVPQKGVDVALRAFAEVAASNPGAGLRLLVAGEGTERASLEQLARQLGTSEHVRFLGFVADTSQVVPAADIFLIPSRIEAQGIVVLEAMASGCDVIASEVGGIPEIAGGHVTLCPPDDGQALADALRQAVSRAQNRRPGAVSNAARQHVETRFDAGRQCDQVIDLAEELAGGLPHIDSARRSRHTT